MINKKLGQAKLFKAGHHSTSSFQVYRMRINWVFDFKIND